MINSCMLPSPSRWSARVIVFYVLCRGEFQVGPCPVPAGYPRAPGVPLHHSPLAGRPHVHNRHIRDVLPNGCLDAGKNGKPAELRVKP